MKYYLIVGEVSGDLHASHLMNVLQAKDPQAEFRSFGGDLMAAVGGTLVRRYKELTYMGFISVLLHSRTIFASMKRCKEDIVARQPDVLVLVGYPGFNLNIAKFIYTRTQIPVFCHISPKIQVWREYRIKSIKRDIDELFSTPPFEVGFLEGEHRYPTYYVSNPTMDKITAFQATCSETPDEFRLVNGLSLKPIIALLAGNHKQEAKGNLPDTTRAATSLPDYQLVLAGVPGIFPEHHKEYAGSSDVRIIFSRTYPLLRHAEAVLAIPGTAVLRTVLLRVPQTVCYHTPIGKVIVFLKRRALKVKYISLVNLIADREAAKEPVTDTMTVEQVRAELQYILYDGGYRRQMFPGYGYMASRLGKARAPGRAAKKTVTLPERSFKEQDGI